MENLYIHSKEQFDCIIHLKLIYEKCEVYRIYLNLEKCKLMVHQGKILGHIIFENVILKNVENIKVITELSCPKNSKGVKCFMGHFEYYHRFIYMYTIITKPLYALLIVFEWMDECEEAFEKLKKALM